MTMFKITAGKEKVNLLTGSRHVAMKQLLAMSKDLPRPVKTQAGKEKR